MRKGDQNGKRPQIAGKLYLIDIPLVLSRGQTKITDTTGATSRMIFDSVSSNSVNFLESYDNLLNHVTNYWLICACHHPADNLAYR